MVFKFLMIAVLASVPAWAAPGDLDLSFDTDGIVKAAFPATSDAGDVVLQSDGKIVVAGLVDDGVGNSDFLILRTLADGSPDGTFGTAGKVLASHDTADSSQKAVLAGDGSVIVAGRSSFDLAVSRYLPDGTQDLAFGDNGFAVLTAIGPAEFFGDVAVQADGKIVVGGTRHITATLGDFVPAAVRFLPDGTLDADFGSGGVALAPVPAGAGRAMALQPDGKIIVGGRSGNDTLLVRFNTDGSLDPDFGGTGIVTQSFVTGIDAANALALQPDGKIVAACQAVNPAGDDMAIARFNADGTLDTSFNGTGFRIESLATNDDAPREVALLDNGKIVLGGIAYEGTEGAFGVMRVNPDGSLDTTFSGDGKARIVAGLNARAEAVAVDAIGRVVLAGQADDQITLVRLEGDSADLSVTLAVEPAAVETGDPVTLTATVVNGGTAPVGAVTLTASIPAGLSVEETTPACSGTSGLQCALGTLAAGGSSSVTIEVRANAAGTFSPQVSVEGQAADPSAGNNAASLSVTVTEPEVASSSGGCSLVGR